MKKKTRTARKVLSVFLSVLMILTTLTVAAPGFVLAAGSYYVRVYLNIYDGANSDGYGNPYTVVTDPSSEFYGKPDDYKWDYGSSWSATDNSKGYDGEVNMAGFTLFYDNDKKYETYDLSADLVNATTILGNNWTSMDDLTLENFASWPNKVEKVYGFELDSLPSSLFWINDENNAINGETSFGIYKITVAETSTGPEHTLWSGLSGSESYYECYYGTITPTGLITPWDDCPDAQTYTFYKDYTTSAVGTWIDPYNAGEYNTYPVNNYLSGGVSATFTVGNSGSQTNTDYVDVGNTNNYFINFTNHSTQEATVTLFKDSSKSLVSGYSDGFALASGQTKSFVLNKGSMSGDGTYYDFSFKFKLNNVYNSDGTTQTDFYQAAGIGTWNTTDDLKAIGLPAGESSNAGFTIQGSRVDVQNRFMVDNGILEETKALEGNRTTNVNFEYTYWLDSSNVSTWQDAGLRMYANKWSYYRLHLQPSGTTGTINITGDVANTNTVSISMADLLMSYNKADINVPDKSDRPWAYYNSPCTPYWQGVEEQKWGTLWNDNTPAYFPFCGEIIKGSTTSTNPGKIVFTNMTWRSPSSYDGFFSGTINVYSFDKTDLRNYVYSLGGLGANWAPMRNRFSDAQWNAYEIALKTAKEVLANQKTNQKAVTDAYNNLYSATEALKATASLKSQVAEVTYTKRTSDYDSAVTDTTSKYIIMPIGTETAVPAYDTYKYATSGNVVGKQSSNLKTNYTQYDTGINPIDYRYWKIDVTGVEEALQKATDLLNTPLDTYSDSYYEKLQDARTALSAFDRDADTWTPTHQSDIDNALATLNGLLAHSQDNYDACIYDGDDEGDEADIVNEKFNCVEGGTIEHVCIICGKAKVVENVAPSEGGHTVDVWTPVDDTNHKGNCTACGEEVTASHIFTNPVLTRPALVDGAWTDGSYTYTCACGATKTEAAERADYSELENAVAELETLLNDENLTADAEAEINEALEKAEDLADNLVTAEQSQINDLVEDLKDVKADVEKAIEESKTTSPITEATSGIGVQFLKKTGVDAVESVQLGANGGFEAVRMRLSNHNSNLPITITKVTADKAYIGADDSAASNVFDTATEIAEAGTTDLYIVAPADFATAGNITYTIEYMVGNADEGYLKDADGNPVVFTTNAFLYAKAAGYKPHHYMDEKVGVGSETSEWDFYLESTNYGDFELVHDNKAPYDAFGNTNLVQDGAGLFDYVREQYDYENDGCYADCADGTYDDGDAHAATYRYYIDTSLAPTYEAAGLRARFVENEAGYYHNAPLKYVRLANNQTYLDKISGVDKTFSVTFLPSSSGTQGMTWTATSNGDMTVSQYNNPDQNNLLFGYHHPNEGCEETTAYANFAGAIPTATEDAKLMFSPRLEFNGPNIGFAEAVTMTTHLYITSYDKAELREAVANAEQAGYNPGYFDSEKYEAYEEALAEAKEVLGKAETNQTEVDEATAALNAAIADLTKAENEAKFVLTVTHSIHENADKNSTATGTEYDYYLVNGTVTPALNAAAIALDTINKYDNTVTLNVTADAAHTYNYWFIDYTGVQDAINAADAIINDTTTGYSDEYKGKAEAAKNALQDILDGENATTTPESQKDVTDAIDAVTALTGHTCDEAVEIPVETATCTATGLTAGAKCSVCGKITKAQTETPMAAHTPGEVVVENNKAATCTAEGSYDNVTYCTKCGTQTSRETITVDKAAHSYGDGVVTAPTCTAGGYTTYTCTVCSHSYTDNETSAINHSWSVSYEWADDYSTCTATRVCANDAKHNVTAEATVTSEVTDEATCEENGTTTYTAEFEADWASKQTKAVKNVPAINHSWSVSYEWADDYSTCTATRVCANDAKHNVTAEATVTSEVTDKATCEGTGTTTYTAEFKADWASKQTKEKTIPAINHDYDIANAELVARPELIDGEWTDGKYEATCRNDESHKLPLEGVKRADYSTFEAAIEELKELAAYENFTDEVKNAILAYAEKLENGEVIPLDYVGDYTYYDVTIKGEQDKVDAAVLELTKDGGIIDQIEGNKDKPEYTKPDYSEWDKAETAYDALTEEELANVKAEIITEAEALKAEIAAKKADKTLTQATATQKDIDDATARLNEIVAGIKDGTLVKPDYSGAEEAIEDAKEVADSENIPDDTEAEIEAEIAELEEQLKAIKDSNPSSTDEEVKKEIAEIEQAAKDIIDTYGECAKGNHTDVETDGDHNCDVCGKLDVTSHNYVNPQLTRPVYDEEKGEWSDGYYTSTCNCGDTSETTIARADYKAYDKAVADLNALLNTGKLTQTAVDMINAALEANDILDDYVATSEEQAIVDSAAAALQLTLGELTDENGLKKEYEKVDFTNYKAAVDAAKALEDVMTDEDKAAVEAEKQKVTDAGITEETSKAAGQQILDNAAAAIAAINAKYGDCADGNHNWSNPVLTTEPSEGKQGEYTETCTVCGTTQITKVDLADYSEFNSAVEALENLANTENLTTEAAKAIADALAMAEELDKNLPADATTVDGKLIKGGQDEINALVAQLQQVVADTNTAIGNGSALLPDYDAWNEAEGRYDALDKTNVKAEIITEAEALKAEIAAKEADKTLTQATATQVRINEATARLNEIIAGIEGGTLKNPDYSGAEEAIKDAKEIADSENIPDDTEAEIEAEIAELEEQLNEIKDSNPSSTDEEVNNKIAEIEQAAKDIIVTYGECAKGNHSYADATCTAPKTCEVCGATDGDANGHTWKAEGIFTADKSVAPYAGYYTYDCENCEATTVIRVEAADYSELENAVEALEKIIEDNPNLTDEAKKEIQDAIDKAEALPDDLTKATTDEETGITTPDGQSQIDDIIEELAGIKTEIENEIKDGSALKPDYTEWDKAETAYNALDKTMADEKLVAEAEALKAEIADKQADDTLTQATATQKDIDDATARLNEIVAEITGVLNSKPDFNGYDGSHDDYEDLVEQYGDKIKDSVANDVAALDTIVEGIRDNENATKGEYQDDIDDAKTDLDAIIAGIIDGSLRDPDYTDVEEKLDIVNGTDNLTPDAQDKIDEIEEALEEIRNKEPEANANDQPYIDILEEQLGEIIDAIEDGSALVPDYTDWEAAKGAYDALVKDNVNADIVAEAEALKAEIAGKQANDTLTQATATQKDIDDATKRLNEIIAGINDGTHIKSADFTEVDKDLADAKDKANNNDVIDGVKDDIQEIEDKLNELRNDPTTNIEDQDEIDALEKELEDIIAGIEDGSLVKPDYEAWEDAEGAYDKLDTTNVKEEIITEANALKAEIAAKQADDTLTQATATQKDIDDATARLNEIIDGIEDGSLKKDADFTEVDKDLADAKDKANNNDVIDGVKEDIKEIEDRLNELKNDPTTNIEDQPEIDNLEKALEEIIAGIEDGSLVKPDYTDADEAIKDAEGDIDNGGKLSDEDKAAIDELKEKLDEIKNDPTSNKKDDQPAVDSIKDQIQDIIKDYAECIGGNHKYEEKVVLPTCTEGGYTEFTCTVCGKNYRGNEQPSTGHVEDTLPAREPTCSEVGLTEGKKCIVCGEILVAQKEIAKLPHVDADDDGVCDHCHYSGLYDGCACLCHNNHWFWHIVYLIIRIIWRVFKIHPVCPCGRIHY